MYIYNIFNIDNILKTTTRGTPQDTEVDVYKMFEIGLEFSIDIINYLSYNFESVNVVLVQGNHDKLLSYMLIKALEQKDFVNRNVCFDSSVAPRKYITIGDSLIGLGHLDNENKKQKKPMSKFKKFLIKTILIFLFIFLIIIGIWQGIEAFKWNTLAKQMCTNTNSIVVDLKRRNNCNI